MVKPSTSYCYLIYIPTDQGSREKQVLISMPCHFFFGEIFVYSTFCSHASMGTRDFVVTGWPAGSIHPVYASLQPHPTDVHVGHDNNNFSNEFLGLVSV